MQRTLVLLLLAAGLLAGQYQGDGVRLCGFSELGKLLRQTGADELRSIRDKIDAGALRGI